MMNRSNSDEAAYVPSMMSFVGLEGSNLKQHHLWDCWETNSHNPNTPAAAAPLPNTTNLLNHAFFAHSTATTTTPPPLLLPTFLDCPVQPPPPPPLFPLNSFPFYSAPHVAAEYPVGLVKREDGAVGSSSGRIGLNLGHRTYFSSADAFAIDRLFARSRSMYSLSHHQPPRCQAEGCKADLSGAKHYHRRHKVCEFHSKATVVVAAGLQQRFCQQCSRFHVLAEFDEAKRSCRKRLADHNRRRRKPQLPAATSESSSSKKDHSSKTTEKCKQIQKTNSRDSTTTKFTTTACTGTNTSTSISLEGQQSYQGKGNQLRNVAALSLGGVGPVEKVGMRSATVYQGGQGPFVPVAQGKFSQRQQQQQDTNTFSSAASNSSFFHHLNLFSSNEASHQSTEGGGGGSGHCTSQHQSGLLHLGQAMFEVDYL